MGDAALGREQEEKNGNICQGKGVCRVLGSTSFNGVELRTPWYDSSEKRAKT